MTVNRPERIGPDGGGLPKFAMPTFRLPSRVKRWGIVAGVLLFLFLVVLNTCFTYVRPNEFGIKEVRIGMNRGIQNKAYPPGYAFQIPVFEKIHRFPRSVQVLELTDFPVAEAYPGHTLDNSAKIQTSDGFYVDVDVTILYRIVDPYLLLTTIGPGDQYIHQGLMPKAEPILKDALGKLNTEDFYDSPLRTEKAEEARVELDKELSSKGMKVDHVLVRYFAYSDEIQKNIEEKKLQDQLVFKNQSEKFAATEMAKVIQVKQEGEMAVKLAIEEGEAYRVTTRAESDLYKRTKEAEADLAVQLAEAEKTRMKNAAMMTLGSEKAVALKMAEVLEGLDAIVVPVGGTDGFNPLDLRQMTELFAAPGAATILPVTQPAANEPPAPALPAEPAPATETSSPTTGEVKP